MNLAEHIAAHALDGITHRYSTVPYTSPTWQSACYCGWEGVEHLHESGARHAHAEHVAETWAEHRTITTVGDGLDLPDGTVLRDVEGEVHLLHAPSLIPISLPATIIFHPEEDQ